MMSPMDVDLIVLTPKKSIDLGTEEKKGSSSRKLFNDDDFPINDDGENTSVNQSQPLGTNSFQQLERRSVQHEDTSQLVDRNLIQAVTVTVADEQQQEVTYDLVHIKLKQKGGSGAVDSCQILEQ